MWRRKHEALPALLSAALLFTVNMVEARIPSRERVVNARGETTRAALKMNRRVWHDESLKEPAYGGRGEAVGQERKQKEAHEMSDRFLPKTKEAKSRGSQLELANDAPANKKDEGRDLASQNTTCCSNFQNYDSSAMCSLYGEDHCAQGGEESGGNNEGGCRTRGFSFIGVSFSVRTAHGHPYSYQLCDQLPLENIIDRDYNYIMSMDEDGWLVGGGYRTFDYSGKMPYIDSSHTELLRIGNMNPADGGTTIEQVYSAVSQIHLPILPIYPEYLKVKAKNDDGTNHVPSADVTLIVSIVETYNDGGAYSDYEIFLNNLFSGMHAVGGGPCMDDHDTDPHVTIARGVKFKSSFHMYQYMYNNNLEVAVWQAMYPYGVPIGSAAKASFPPNSQASPSYVGYGNLYFFYDRVNITKAFFPGRDLTCTEKYYSTFMSSSNSSVIEAFYEATTYIPFNWNRQSGSESKNENGDSENEWKYNPDNWTSDMARNDMTNGWYLPPNCQMEGETFFGIPLSAKSSSKLQSTKTFQEQFDFDLISDYNYTYVNNFGTNHGWLIGEQVNNEVGTIVDKDTAHIPLFYMGTTNPDMGGMSLSNMIKVAKHIKFGTLYIKPAFVFLDSDGDLYLQFEADSSSALGQLYNSLCRQLGISWNNHSPSNKYGLYTSCAMHAAGDRASYGCGPDNSNIGGFCPRMAVAYRLKFKSSDDASTFLQKANTYVDYWRNLYPSGVAVGTSSFCPKGGCLGLFLNRLDLYQVFRPNLEGSWVEYNDASELYATPASTNGSDNNPANAHYDVLCDGIHNKRVIHKAQQWKNLGLTSQACIVLLTVMASTLSVSIFLASARRRKRKGESYFGCIVRNIQCPTRNLQNRRLMRKLDDERGVDILENEKSGHPSVQLQQQLI